MAVVGMRQALHQNTVVESTLTQVLHLSSVLRYLNIVYLFDSFSKAIILFTFRLIIENILL